MKLKEWVYWILGWDTKKIEPPPKPIIKIAPKPQPPRIKKCSVKDKYCFTRDQAAVKRDELEKNTAKGFLRIYCCEFCNAWHLTKKRRHDW